MVVFLSSLVWIPLARWVAGSSATGITERFAIPAAEPTFEALFWCFLLGIGFSLLEGIGRQRSSVRDLLALPRRPTAAREWALGAAIGWASAVVVVLPLALAGALRVQVSFAGHDLGLTALSLLGLALLAFAEETAFRGFPLRLLRSITGSSVAALGMAVVFGLASAAHPASTPRSVFLTTLLGLVLCVGWLRTRGIWLSWGLNFALKAAATILFGLPVNGTTSFAYLVQTFSVGRAVWTGGNYGLPASWISLPVLLLAWAAVMRLTRDYAWSYTQPVIVAGGYPVDVPPPAAHAAMETQAAPPAGSSLVQILPASGAAFTADANRPEPAGSAVSSHEAVVFPRDEAP